VTKRKLLEWLRSNGKRFKVEKCGKSYTVKEGGASKKKVAI